MLTYPVTGGVTRAVTSAVIAMAAGFSPNTPDFHAPLNDLGSGAVNTALARGAGSATFTRATAAWTVNSAGTIIQVASGVPRSYYDPASLEYGGYLPEPARTNLFTRSSEFNDASWSKAGVTVSADATTSPDGTANADSLIEDTATSTHAASKAATITAGAAVAISVWVKAAVGIRYVRIQLSSDAGANGFRALFNPADGSQPTAAAAFGTGTLLTTGFKAYPNGWYRVWATGTVDPAATTVTCNLFMQNAIGFVATYTGDGASGVHLWGAQCENNARLPSSYIPTAGTTVTRNNDLLQYQASGNVNYAAGTAYGEVRLHHSAQTNVNRALIGVSPDAYPLIYFQNVATTTIGVFDGTGSGSRGGQSDASSAIRRKASAWGGGTMVCAGDGSIGSNAAFDGAMGSGVIYIGSLGGGQQLTGTIKNAKIWRQKATNSQVLDMVV